MQMQPGGMDSNLRRTERTVDLAAVLLAKVPVFFLAVLSGGLVARTALPAVAGALSSGATPLWPASRPLYPFFVVNLIIFVIWRLSDWEQHGPAEEKPPEAGVVLVKARSSGANPTEPLAGKPSPETWKEIPAATPIAPAVLAAAIPVTVPAPHHVETPPTPAKLFVCSEFDTNIAVPESGAKVAEEEVPPLEVATKGEVEEEEDDDENPPMEVMWKAIMEKRSRVTTTTSQQVTPPRGERQPAAQPLPVFKGRETSPLASRDESNRLYNDFIMKHRHEQMRDHTKRIRDECRLPPSSSDYKLCF